MRYKYLSRAEAQKLMHEAGEDPRVLIEQIADDEFYMNIRNHLIHSSQQIKDQTQLSSIKNHEFDLRFGLEIYDYFTKECDIIITLRDASNPDFWRFLSVLVIPDIVAERWNINRHERFYSNPTRIWLYTLWWYVYLAWDGSTEKTYFILKNNTTDTILNLVERVGYRGYNVELYREILKQYNKIEKDSLPLDSERDIFRTIMVNNTTFYSTTEPSFYKNGIKGYVKKLFELSGLVEIDGKYVAMEEINERKTKSRNN